MRAKILLFTLLFAGGSLFAQDYNEVVFDFGLKTGFKWYNGKSIKMRNASKSTIKEEVYPHVNYPKLAFDFTLYPAITNLGFETMIGYNQFSGAIHTRSNTRLNASDYPRNVLFFQENIKYVFAFGQYGTEFVFQPYVGLGLSYVAGKSDFISTKVELTDETGHYALGADYDDGLRPIYNTSYDLDRAAFNLAFGLDFEVRTGNFGFLFGFGYDLGLNNFYKQKLEYKYHAQDIKTETLKYYNSGFQFSIGLKYLFR